MTKTYRCKVCGRDGLSAPKAMRHVALAHKLDQQPHCRREGCEEVADAHQPRAAKGNFTVCRKHAMRYATCRWCGGSLADTYGQISYCHCWKDGALHESVLSAPEPEPVELRGVALAVDFKQRMATRS